MQTNQECISKMSDTENAEEENCEDIFFGAEEENCEDIFSFLLTWKVQRKKIVMTFLVFLYLEEAEAYIIFFHMED